MTKPSRLSIAAEYFPLGMSSSEFREPSMTVDYSISGISTAIRRSSAGRTQRKQDREGKRPIRGGESGFTRTTKGSKFRSDRSTGTTTNGFTSTTDITKHSNSAAIGLYDKTRNRSATTPDISASGGVDGEGTTDAVQPEGRTKDAYGSELEREGSSGATDDGDLPGRTSECCLQKPTRTPLPFESSTRRTFPTSTTIGQSAISTVVASEPRLQQTEQRNFEAAVPLTSYVAETEALLVESSSSSSSSTLSCFDSVAESKESTETDNAIVTVEQTHDAKVGVERERASTRGLCSVQLYLDYRYTVYLFVNYITVVCFQLYSYLVLLIMNNYSYICEVSHLL